MKKNKQQRPKVHSINFTIYSLQVLYNISQILIAHTQWNDNTYGLDILNT